MCEFCLDLLIFDKNRNFRQMKNLLIRPEMDQKGLSKGIWID